MDGWKNYGYNIGIPRRLSYSGNVDAWCWEQQDFRDYIQRAEIYADGICKPIKDQTNKEAIKVEAGMQGYTRIGPFKFSFPYLSPNTTVATKYKTGLTQLKVYNQSNSEINGFKITTFIGNQEKEIGVEEITPGLEIYISIPNNAGVERISKITGTGTMNEKWAKLTFFYSSDKQNLMLLRKTYYGDAEGSINFTYEYDIPITGSVTISKIDADTGATLGTTPKFIIRHQDGQYLTGGLNGTVAGYTGNINSATRYQSGHQINLTRSGTYTFLEVQNPGYGYPYASVSSPINLGSINVTLGQNQAITLRNSKQTGNLRIYKRDYDNQNVGLGRSKL